MCSHVDQRRNAALARRNSSRSDNRIGDEGAILPPKGAWLPLLARIHISSNLMRRTEIAIQARELIAATRYGINKTIGWHTFRHDCATHLKANGEDVKAVPRILRHANRRITLDTYTQATTPTKRHGQSEVVSMILVTRTQTAAGEKGSEPA
jgi:integrase